MDFSFFRTKKNNLKPVVLLSLDGFGIAPKSQGNAVARAHMPNFTQLQNQYPHTSLIASGESVGLPANEVGNSEVGHLIMGVGRVILQKLKRINQSIESGEFFQNEAFLGAIGHIKRNQSHLHIMGLIGSGNVHASVAHLYALIELCKRHDLKDVTFHLFTDGRDSPPRESLVLIEEIISRISLAEVGQIGSLCGRYYAMDRDGRWQRTQKTYEMLVAAKGKTFESPQSVIAASYKDGLTDEFIEPSMVLDSNGKLHPIQDNDAVIFSNFRTDRPRQLTMAFVMPDFEHLHGFETQPDFKHGKKQVVKMSGPTFNRSKKLNNLFFVTMMEYQKNMPVSAVAFPFTIIDLPCSEVISQHNLPQLHLAESEKETMVSYYFDGLRDTQFSQEDLIIIPSQKVPRYDKKPEMSVYGVADTLVRQLKRGKYPFVMMNFANPDMVAHTGNLAATIKALEHTDKALGFVVAETLRQQGTLLITADHGNAEELLSYPQRSFFFTSEKGQMNTDHSNNPVPFVAVRADWKSKQPRILKPGSLADIAPTILALLNLPVPSVMTGKNLLE
ncbi:2,3-bisphosphoglycerate-independent phosphoglycerate mutase [Candidatus Microgenomates bacterium]|nr:MAG: 2,3-bisphosphoglycerate-independent phosphoglycerate mutase [Candidatus Microgenomates bacterium]